jgi:hypothetical protein
MIILSDDGEQPLQDISNKTRFLDLFDRRC